MKVACVNIKSRTGELVPISALIVPTIATPLRNAVKLNITQLVHFSGLPLAHPITQYDSFKVSLSLILDP